MPNAHYSYVCRNMTTFNANAKFDANAFAQYVERFIEPQIGFYCASSGSGLGQALSWQDLKSVYQTAVSVAKGKVPVGANIPEQYTAKLSTEHALLAVECGVDIVNIYGADGRHSYRASEEEYILYFDRILSEVKHPISLCPNPTIGYAPKPTTIAKICEKHPQVQNVVLTGLPGAGPYYTQLRDALTRDVDIYPTVPGSLNYLLMGAAGLAGSEANILPKTMRRYLDAVSAGNLEEAASAYLDLERTHIYTAPWSAGGGPRMLSMFLKLFKLPGANGVLPDPFIMFDDDSYEEFAAGMLELNVAELNEMARAAGL